MAGVELLPPFYYRMRYTAQYRYHGSMVSAYMIGIGLAIDCAIGMHRVGTGLIPKLGRWLLCLCTLRFVVQPLITF